MVENRTSTQKEIAMYYRILIVEREDRTGDGSHYQLEFHTGDNEQQVYNFQSLNHGIQISQSNGERMQELLANWQDEIELYNLTRAKGRTTA